VLLLFSPVITRFLKLRFSRPTFIDESNK
jgi:hypothetical protein